MQKEKVSRFWDNFVKKTKRYNVPSKSTRWYVKHVESYIKAHPQLRLALHTEQNLTRYLEDLGRTGHLNDWQFKQAVDALRILFVDMVRSSWATAFPWRYWADSATALPNDHATVTRSYSQPAAIDPGDGANPPSSTAENSFINLASQTYPDHFAKLIAAIRIRQYSIRTE